MRVYDKKTFYVAILWTSIALVVGLFFWLNRRSSQKAKTPAPSVRLSPAVSPRRQAESSTRLVPKSALITLNDIYISSDPSMTILGSCDELAELCETVGDTYLMYTVPGELAGGDDVSASVRASVEAFVSRVSPTGFKNHRIIYTNTREGRTSVARQLQVELTIDPDADIVDQLQGKVPNIVCVLNNGDFAKIFRKFFS